MPKQLPPCRRCTKPMVPGTAKKVPRGKVAHKSRHLCRGCFVIERQAGRLDAYPLVTRRQHEIIRTAAELAEAGMTRLEIISYLGVSRGAFERAHYRAGVKLVRL